MFNRLGSVLMPHLAFSLNDKTRSDEEDIPLLVKRQVAAVIGLLLTSATIVGALGILALPHLVVPWLGAEYAPAEMPVSVLSACIGILALYSVLSGAVNAADTRALNTLNLTIVLLVTGGLLLIRRDLDIVAVTWIQAFGYTLLAALTVLTVCRLYGISFREAGVAHASILAIVNAGLTSLAILSGYAAIHWVGWAIFLLAIDGFLIWVSKPSWLQAILRKIPRSRNR